MTDPIEAAAEVIRAVGFDMMASEFITRPEYRERILRAMYRNIKNDRKFGPEMADKFWRLAAPIVGLRIGY